MTTKPDGGPAFPQMSHSYSGIPYNGMSLRDYFAAKAMQALVNRHARPGDSLNCIKGRIAHEAYDQADAMLQARERTLDAD